LATKQSIIEILYLGFMDYVPKKRLVEYQNEFTSRKTHNTKFALEYFPKYINFKKAIKKPLKAYDTLLLNYWIIEVPVNGLKWSKLISNYEYGMSRLVNQRLKAEKNKTKSRTKLLLTKKQKQEIKAKKLYSTKEPFLQGEVIRRMKADPEYAAKVKAIALKNSEKKLNYTEKLQAMAQNKKENQSYLNGYHKKERGSRKEAGSRIAEISSSIGRHYD